MFGFKKKIEIKKIDINEGYRNYLKKPDKIVIICVDEQKEYDAVRIPDSECLPLRLINKMEDYYPEKDLTYYVYAINFANSEAAYKKLYKKGYDVYDLGSFLDYHEEEDGYNARRKRRKRIDFKCCFAGTYCREYDIVFYH